MREKIFIVVNLDNSAGRKSTITGVYIWSPSYRYLTISVFVPLCHSSNFFVRRYILLGGSMETGWDKKGLEHTWAVGGLKVSDARGEGHFSNP